MFSGKTELTRFTFIFQLFSFFHETFIIWFFLILMSIENMSIKFMRQCESHGTQITLMRFLPLMNSLDMIVQSLFQSKSLFAMKTTKRFDLKIKKAKVKKNISLKFRPVQITVFFFGNLPSHELWKCVCSKLVSKQKSFCNKNNQKILPKNKKKLKIKKTNKWILNKIQAC